MARSLRQTVEDAVLSGRLGDMVTGDGPEDNFASNVVFAEIRVASGSGDATDSLPVAIKRQRDDERHRSFMHMDGQFYNEVTMYEETIPYLGAEGMFPRYVYGRATLGADPKKDILVVEDLRRAGFRTTKEKIFLDFEHCALALRKLAQFHSLSYSKKRTDMMGFLERVGKLKRVNWVYKNEEDKEEANKFMRVSIERGLAPLGEELSEEASRLREELRDTVGRMADLCLPEEPLAVLCHGDFCRNNILFRYEDGRPVDMRLIDVATARHASPAIDLAFFLLMNTSREVRARWDDLVTEYYDNLTDHPPGVTMTVDTVRRELTGRLAYGYVICSFFLPIMVVGKGEDEDWSELTPKELLERSRSLGGDVATRHVTDVARHVLRLRAEAGHDHVQ